MKLIEAAQCTTAVTELAIRSRCIGEMPRPGDSRSAATAAHAPAARTRAGRDERLEQLVDPRLGGGVVLRAHERHDVAVGLLEHAREQLHPDEAGGPGEQQRARIGRGGHAASRHSDALWPPNPNEFDRATGGRPLAISSGRAVPGT